MAAKKENDLLEEVLALAGKGYSGAYRFLLEEYEKSPGAYGAQTLYFLACLAGGAGQPEKALAWLKKAILDNGWWYRPQVLEDDDLSALNDRAEFAALKALSDARYSHAFSEARAVFSWKSKNAENLFLAVHGNNQNARIAREDWAPLLEGDARWQLETIQSPQPDGYGTYRWSYDTASCLPVAGAIEKVQNKGYQTIVCGGFSAGCDMLLRSITFTPVRCDMLILQSPWIPVLEEDGDAVLLALRQKGVELKILCGAEDEDCLPMAKQLAEAARRAGIPSLLLIQEGSRHQFSWAPGIPEGLLDVGGQVCLTPMTAEMYREYFKEYENDPDLYLDKESYAPYLYREETVERYISRQSSPDRRAFAIVHGGEMVGEVILKNIEPGKCATLSIAMRNARYKDRGFGTRAELLAVEYAFCQLDLPTVYADTILTNTRSQHVLEKVGFRFIREDDQFRYYRIDRPI